MAAKSLTIGQALLIASICEFSGAIGLGASVTRTIKNSIADINEFVSTPGRQKRTRFMFLFLIVSIRSIFNEILIMHFP